LLILSHRGYWKRVEEKNQKSALDRAILRGYGIETDIRDYQGKLVIAHDIPNRKSLSFDVILRSYRKNNSSSLLALNIKADGLQDKLKQLLEHYDIQNYFVFDMSIPDTLVYLRKGLCVFTRQSEYEPQPSLYSEAAGVWMDMFFSEWVREKHILSHLNKGKQVALVSPELHGRPHLPFWNYLLESPVVSSPRLMLCTDYPDSAREFFDE
jgi:hypothetical protein